MKHGLMALTLLLGWPVSALGGGPEKNPESPWYLTDAERRWHIDGLLGGELEPDYVGSDERETEPAVALRALFWDRLGNRYTVALGEVGVVFYPGERWALALDLEYEEGRETAETELAALADGEATLEGELTLFRRFSDSYAFATFQPDLLGRGKGQVYFLGYGRDWLGSGERWRISPRIDVSFADSEHMQTEFGLTPAQAEALGLDPYRPGGGLKSTTLGVSAQRYFRSRWSLLGSFEAEFYHGRAADSPLVAVLGSDVGFEATLGLHFVF